MPHQNRNPKQEHFDQRIPGAQFFDIDEIADKTIDIPHMMPPLDLFIENMKRLRVRKTDDIICYDNIGIFSSPRLAFTLKYFGAEKVRVLNGGMKKWLNENRPTESGPENNDNLE